MNDATQEAAEKIRDGKAAVGDAAKKVVDEASRRPSDVADRVKQAGSQAADYVREQYGNVTDQAQHAYQNARDKAYQWEHEAESFVQRKPLQALLIAAGVGLLAGLLWKRHD